MSFLRLFCLRHGETVESRKYTFNGWTDVDLTEEGKRQLDEAALALKGLHLDAIYSSDLKRAMYGGQALAKQTGLELNVEPEFREVHFGDCEGLRFPQIKERYPLVADDILRPDGGEFLFPGGEGAKVFRERIMRAQEKLLAKHPQGSVALVSHSGVGRALLANALGLTNTKMWTLTQDFACLNVIDFMEDGGVRILLINGFLGPEGYHQRGPGFARFIQPKN
jgi:broad specificity phosphatase PhoE